MKFQDVIEGLTLANHGDNETAITINHGDFKGVVFKFGRVWFPDPEQPILSFEYDLISTDKKIVSLTKDNPDFRLLLGNILQQMLVKAMGDGTAVYSGGVEEVIEGDGGEYMSTHVVPERPSIFTAIQESNKIMLPEDYKVPEPEYGTSMSRNLLA